VFDDWLERNAENIERIDALRDAAEAGDRDELESIADGARANERRADALAREIGLRKCAERD
jgi:hypothetical protein